MVLVLFLIICVMPRVIAVVKNTFTVIIDPDSVTVSAPAEALCALVPARLTVQANVATVGIMQFTVDKTPV